MKTKPDQGRLGAIAAMVAVLLVAGLALPGDVTLKAQDLKPPVNVTPAEDASLPPNLDGGDDAKTKSESTQRDAIEIRTYDYRESIENSLSAGQTSEPAIKQAIESTLVLRMNGWDDQHDADPEPKMAWIGTKLHLFATADQHSIAQEHHSEKDLNGLPQITIYGRFFESKHPAIAKVFSAIGIRWYAIPSINTEGWQTVNDPSASIPSTPVAPVRYARWKATSSQTVSSHQPLLISFLDHNEMKALVMMVQESSDANLLQAPTMTLFDCHQATIQSAGLRPFVTSVSWNETEGATSGIEVVRDGMLLHVMPHVLDRDIVGLRFACEQSNIPSVAQFDLPTKGKDSRLQSPEVILKRFATDLTTRVGETVLFGWLEPQVSGETKVRLVALTSEVMDYAGKFGQPKREWSLPSDDERTAMKRGLVPLKHFPGPEALVPSDGSANSPVARDIPFPAEFRKKLATIGASISATNLTGFQMHENAVAILEGDSIDIDFDQDKDFSFLGLKRMSLRSKHVRIKLSEGELACDFIRAVSINSNEIIGITAESGSMRYRGGEHAAADSELFELSLQGNVHFDGGPEMRLTGDRLLMNNNGWKVEGNATVSAEVEPGNAKQLRADRIEMNRDFPALMIERDVTGGEVPHE